MAANDIRIHSGAGRALPNTYTWLRDDRDTSADTQVRVGEPLKGDDNADPSQFAFKWVDLDVTIGTDETVIGIAADDSTETASADGVVEVYMPLPGVIYEIQALSAAAVDTDSEINALRGEDHVISLDSSVYTIDTAAGHGVNNAMLIIGGDSTRSAIWFMLRSDSTVFGRAQV